MREGDGADDGAGPSTSAAPGAANEAGSSRGAALGAPVTDEELFAYTRDLEEAAPFGLWFGRLEEVEQQAAALGAVRARAVRGEIGADLGLAEVPVEITQGGLREVQMPPPRLVASFPVNAHPQMKMAAL